MRWREAPRRGTSWRGVTDELASRLLPLVRRIAVKLHRRLPPQVELDELVGAGSLGLVDALRKFDPRKGVKLETYASHRIRGAIIDSLRCLDPASRDLRAKCKEVAAVQWTLEGRLGRPAEDSDMASEMGLDLAQWHRLAHELQPLAPPRQRSGQGLGELRISDFEIASSNADDPFNCCYRAEQREILNRTLAGLPKREQVVLTLYYQQGLTMKGVAERLGVDESRVSQIHSVARTRLAKRVNARLRNPVPMNYIDTGFGREQVPNQSKNSLQIW